MEAKIDNFSSWMSYPSDHQLKTDIEGYWYEFAKELLNEQIEFKYWVTEIELGLNDNYENNFEQIREIYSKFKDKYKIVINRKRLKPMLELGFIKNA